MKLVRPLLCLFVSILCLSHPSVSQQANNQVSERNRVPGIGCPSDGQQGPVEAPKVPPTEVLASSREAQGLAYYKAEYGDGVLAPRGWHCFATYGSSGVTLYVAPEAFRRDDFFRENRSGFHGPAVELSTASGGTSGRFTVAKKMARLFPEYRWFVQRVIAEGIEPAKDFPVGPFPNETLTYRDKRTVEYVTPAYTYGTGTDSSFMPTADPIQGVVMLHGEDLDAIQLSVRFPAQSRKLAKVIVRQAEADVARQP